MSRRSTFGQLELRCVQSLIKYYRVYYLPYNLIYNRSCRIFNNRKLQQLIVEIVSFISAGTNILILTLKCPSSSLQNSLSNQANRTLLIILHDLHLLLLAVFLSFNISRGSGLFNSFYHRRCVIWQILRFLVGVFFDSGFEGGGGGFVLFLSLGIRRFVPDNIDELRVFCSAPALRQDGNIG